MVDEQVATIMNISIKRIMTIILCSCVFANCYVLSAVQDITDGNQSLNVPYRWIERDKMRAGYLYYYSPVSKIDLVKKMGLNTVILKCWGFERIKDKPEIIKCIKEWAVTAKDNNIHLFIAINWQPYPGADVSNYKNIVYDDGTEGIAVCPLDSKLWEERLYGTSLLIAELSAEPKMQIDGIFLDMEIYGTEKEPQIKRNYYYGTCDFSDLCFSQYLTYKGYSPPQFPLVEKKGRKDWLNEKKLLDDYFVYLGNQLKDKAKDLLISIHKINPDFLIGIYPHPEKDNWVQHSLAEGLSSEKLPLIVFGVHSYGYPKDKNGDGYTFIPKDIKQQYKRDGINILYSAGYLLHRYESKALERNLNQSIKYWDGYWLFNLQQLWDENTGIGKLTDSAEHLVKAVSIVNSKKDLTFVGKNH